MSAPGGLRRVAVVAVIGSTQTIAWASSYYLPAILGTPVAESLGLPHSAFFAVFSASLLLSALLGPSIGRVIDRYGGRSVLALSHVVIGIGLVLLATSHGITGLTVAWAVLGIGMAAGLYDPAFAALTRLYGHEARTAITGITLIAGFASTIGWPLTAFWTGALGWRAACLIWAAINIGLALPLNLMVIPRIDAPPPLLPRAAVAAEPVKAPAAAMPVLAFYFAATWFVTAAMGAHLPRLFQMAGASASAAIAAAALVGPAQVAGRLLEIGYLRRYHPLISARLAALMHPVAAGVLSLTGAGGIVGFAIVHGTGNGIITIAKGTVPLAIFGPLGYGRRNGLLGAPARAAQAAAPLVFGVLLDRFGIGAVAVSAALSLAAAVSLLALRARAAPAAGAAVADD
jgi:MFS family permease